MSPISRMMSDSTVAKTGRLMQISGNCIDGRGSPIRTSARAASTCRPWPVEATIRPWRSPDDRRRGRCRRHRRRLRRRDATGIPSRSFSCPAVTIVSSGADALRISTLPVAALADVDLRARRLAVDDANTYWSSPCGTSACSGTHQRVLHVPLVIRRTRANMPGRSAVSALRHLRADHDRAAGGVDQRVDREDLALVGLARAARRA